MPTWQLIDVTETLTSLPSNARWRWLYVLLETLGEHVGPADALMERHTRMPLLASSIASHIELHAVIAVDLHKHVGPDFPICQQLRPGYNWRTVTAAAAWTACREGNTTGKRRAPRHRNTAAAAQRVDTVAARMVDPLGCFFLFLGLTAAWMAWAAAGGGGGVLVLPPRFSPKYFTMSTHSLATSTQIFCYGHLRAVFSKVA
jgi:hypothetical protein